MQERDSGAARSKGVAANGRVALLRDRRGTSGERVRESAYPLIQSHLKKRMSAQ